MFLEPLLLHHDNVIIPNQRQQRRRLHNLLKDKTHKHTHRTRQRRQTDIPLRGYFHFLKARQAIVSSLSFLVGRNIAFLNYLLYNKLFVMFHPKCNNSTEIKSVSRLFAGCRDLTHLYTIVCLVFSNSGLR